MCKRFPAISVSYMNLFRVFIGPSDYRCPLIGLTAFIDPGARFSKAPETFRARKTIAKSRTLPLQSCFIHIFLIWTEVSFIQEAPRPYTSPFLDTEQLKLTLRARNVSGTSRNGPLVLWFLHHAQLTNVFHGSMVTVPSDDVRQSFGR